MITPIEHNEIECPNCGLRFSEKLIFRGCPVCNSYNYNNTEDILREEERKESLSCNLCGKFDCDGNCEDGGY